MAEVEVLENTLIVRMEGLHKLWAFKSKVKVPLAHVLGVSLYRDVSPGSGLLIRVFGTGAPGLISTGLYRRAGEWEFWDVMDRSKAVVIELTGERFSRLVVEVADPDSTVASLRRALRFR